MKLRIVPCIAIVLASGAPARAPSSPVLIARTHVGGVASYIPSSLTVKQGDKVVFANVDTRPDPASAFAMDYPPHTVSSPDGCGTSVACVWSSGLIGPQSGVFTYTLDTTTLAPGTYTYYCQLHHPMNGVITVTV